VSTYGSYHSVREKLKETVTVEFCTADGKKHTRSVPISEGIRRNIRQGDLIFTVSPTLEVTVCLRTAEERDAYVDSLEPRKPSKPDKKE